MRLSIISYLAPIIGMLMMALHPAYAQPASQQEIIARAEQALSDMKTMQADFIQFSSDGSVGEGRIYFRRPHQLRIDYLNPETLSFVTSRVWIHVDDKIDKQVTSYPISQSPFYTLLQKEISFKDPDLIKLLNDNFYCIELDAESKQNIEFQGTTYKFNYLEGYHQLPLTLTKELDQLVVPSIVIMNNNLDIHSVLHSYQQPKYLIHHLEQLLLN